MNQHLPWNKPLYTHVEFLWQCLNEHGETAWKTNRNMNVSRIITTIGAIIKKILSLFKSFFVVILSGSLSGKDL